MFPLPGKRTRPRVQSATPSSLTSVSEGPEPCTRGVCPHKFRTVPPFRSRRFASARRACYTHPMRFVGCWWSFVLAAAAQESNVAQPPARVPKEGAPVIATNLAPP